MTTLQLNETTVLIHDSPRTLPESRRTEHDYYSLIESGIGSTMADVDRHFDQMVTLIGSPDTDAQLTAVNNTRFLFFHLLEKQYSARSLALCCLVESVNDKPHTDYSPEGLEALSRRLSDAGLTDAILIEQLGDVKKNSILS